MRGAIAVSFWLGVVAVSGVASSATTGRGDVRPEIAASSSPEGHAPPGDMPFDPILQDLSAAWAIPASGLDERVARLQKAGAALGLANLEGPAQALLIDDLGTPYERARAARALAPDLPAARAAMVRAAWFEGELGTAWSELVAATAAVGHHVESRSWLTLFLWHAIWGAALLGGGGFLLLALLVALPSLTRRLGAIPPELPPAARQATLGCLLLLPAALGEGPLGVLLAAAALAAVRGGASQRLALAAAGLLTLAAVYPLLDAAAAARVDLSRQATLAAAQQVERGVASPVERARVALHADVDSESGRAHALAERRAGALAQADSDFSRWLEGASPEALANAATVKFALGQREQAVDLLERAAWAGDDPVILFNLSQAYAGVVAIERQSDALVQAQALDADRTHLLVAHFGPGQFVDRPLRPTAWGPGDFWGVPSKTSVGSAEAVADILRQRIAPGRLGNGAPVAGAALLAALVLGTLLGGLLDRAGQGEADLRTRIAQLIENRLGDAAQRLRHLGELRRREALLARGERVFQMLVPGAAGLLGGRPFLAGVGFLWAAIITTLAFIGSGIPRQPLALGDWPDLVLPVVLAVGVAVHLGLTGLAIHLRERA